MAWYPGSERRAAAFRAAVPGVDQLRGAVPVSGGVELFWCLRFKVDRVCGLSRERLAREPWRVAWYLGSDNK